MELSSRTRTQLLHGDPQLLAWLSAVDHESPLTGGIEMSNHNATEVSGPRPSVEHNPISKFRNMRQSQDPDFYPAAQPCKPFMWDGGRSRLDIIFDVLDTVGAEGEIGPTRIMGKANISWGVLKETMTFLTERAILATQTIGARQVVSLSPIGFRLLETMNVVRSLLMPDADGPRPISTDGVGDNQGRSATGHLFLFSHTR